MAGLRAVLLGRIARSANEGALIAADTPEGIEITTPERREKTAAANNEYIAMPQ